jgi:2-methylcitrate dehydratase PrpD
MNVVEALGEHVSCGRFARPPEDVRDKVFCCIVDAVTAAICGYTSPGATASRETAGSIFGSGRSPVWFTGYALNPIGAAFSNSAAISALDFDDGHRKARGHPGAAIIPVVLAMASARSTPSCDELVAAILAGYEISVRIAAAQNPVNITTRQSGRWTAFGAVAAAASINRSGAAATAAALAIAGCWSPNQQANGSSGYSRQTGNHAKEGIPWSVVTGLTALDLAGRGFTGPGDILDHADYYDPSVIVDELGQRWDILGVYFKPYSCCRYIHPSLDAVVDLVDRYRIQPSDIEAIKVRTFAWAGQLQNRCAPANLVEIQYSLPFCVAAAICRGADALSPIDESLLHDPQIQALAARVTLVVDTEIDRRFPAETLARVDIQTGTGLIASPIVSPRGDISNPITWDGLIDKFRSSTGRHLTAGRQARFISAFASLRAGDPGPLSHQLQTSWPCR